MEFHTKFVVTLSLLLCAAGSRAQSLTPSPASASPTQVISITGSAFGDSEAVDVYIDSVDTLLLVTSATGTFSGSVTIPAATIPGVHYVTAVGRHSGDAAQAAVTVSTPWLEEGFGAAHLGWNPYENVLSPSNVSTLGILWDSTVTAAGATPAVSNGVVIVSGFGQLQALSAATGAAIWTITTPQNFYASPAISGNVFYIVGQSGSFYAKYVASGGKVWSTPIPTGCGYSSAAVAASIVYFGCYTDDKVYALSASSGKVLWTYATGGAIDSSPAVVNGIVYIGSQDEKLYALNATTGALIWTYATGGQVESSPAVRNGVVYVGSDDSNVYALNAKTGALLWKYTTGAAVYASPAVLGATVFIGSADDKLYALNAASGALEWSYTTGGIVRSASVANGVVYATSEDGGAYAFDAANGEVLAFAETGVTLFGRPAVSDGVVYLSTYSGDTYAFSLDAGTSAAQVNALSERAQRRPPVPTTLRPNLHLPVSD